MLNDYNILLNRRYLWSLQSKPELVILLKGAVRLKWSLKLIKMTVQIGSHPSQPRVFMIQKTACLQPDNG